MREFTTTKMNYAGKDSFGNSVFDYRDFRVCTSATKGEDGSWHLMMSYSDPQDRPASTSEVEGFMYEAGMRQNIPVDAWDKNSPFAGRVIHYFHQALPEAPAKEITAARNREKTEVLMSLDLNRFKKYLKAHNDLLPIPAEDLVLESTMHKSVVMLPFSSTSQRLASIDWLHNHGFHASFCM